MSTDYQIENKQSFKSRSFCFSTTQAEPTPNGGDLESYGSDPRRIEYAGANTDGGNVNYKDKYTAAQQTIKDRYAQFEVPYHGVDNDDYVNGQGFCCDDTPKTRSFVPNKNDNPELFQYYYHSDHLGSSSLITNLDGEVVQHIEYVPFGEVFIEERNNKWNTPYLFNAKELDEETGLYYYGARYYDSRASVWLSTDPLQEKYPNISTYTYVENNPIKYIDPDGKEKLNGLNARPPLKATAANAFFARKHIDNNMIHIYAHGSTDGFTFVDGKGIPTQIRSANNLNDLLNVYSEMWRTSGEGKGMHVVLHSCNTGNSPYNTGFAEKMSKEFPDTYFVAPSGQLELDAKTGEGKVLDSIYGEFNDVTMTYEWTNIPAKWNVYKKGEVVRQINPNVQLDDMSTAKKEVPGYRNADDALFQIIQLST